VLNKQFADAGIDTKITVDAQVNDAVGYDEDAVVIYENTTSVLVAPAPAERDALLELPPTAAAHADVVSRHRAVLERVEVASARCQTPCGDSVRIGFWNAERGKYLRASAALLGRLDASVWLLCELDLGMARSGQAHTTRVLAEHLGYGYAFAVEFLELGLGDAREREWHAGEVNQSGLHGAAILAACALERPALIRLETDGAWFDGERGERRVGGRIALAATLRIGGVPVTVVSVHFESHGDPVQRADQLATLIEAIDRYAPGQPALIGGDLNTSTLSRDWARGTGVKPVLPVERVLDPIPHEPLFEVARAHGYDWQTCNTLGVPTQRTRPDGTPRPPLGRIDWFLGRDLVMRDPATMPAVDADGNVISDHDVLVVTIEPRDEAGR
jgi:endonuclease/exonuclease/phosphatase family metal-dependent hydrolase